MTTISLRICLWTDLNLPAGSRLFKSSPRPEIAFDFPCTKEGMEAAKEASRKLQEYIDRTESRLNTRASGVENS